jgi:opacity protein-like surface antigen
MNTKYFALLACISVGVLPVTARGAEAFAQLDLPALPTSYEAAFDWQGFYASVFGQVGDTGHASSGLGGTIGYSWAAEQLILSGEVGMSRSGSGGVDLFLAARAGWLPTETLMLFALGDIGINSHEDGFAGVGAGAELALGANWSVRGQYEYRTDLSASDASHLATVGFAYRF